MRSHQGPTIALPLFRTILLWVFLALFVFTMLGWLWGEGPLWSWQRWLTNWRSAGDNAGPLEVVKVSLTTIGGIGGTGYLVIKYRERASAERAEKAAELARKDIEQEKAEQKLLNAVQQLGSESPQVRIAGVYALADVADTYRGDYRQRVVNILCGYLRTPRGTWHDISSGKRKNILNWEAAYRSPLNNLEYVSNDGAVELTILTVMRHHLLNSRQDLDDKTVVSSRVDDGQLWCGCVFDFRGACFTEKVSLFKSTFGSMVSFEGAKFAQTVDFRGSTFNDITFRRTTFLRGAIFSNARFRRRVSFLNTRSSRLDFRQAHFTGCVFGFSCDIRSLQLEDTLFNCAEDCDQPRFPPNDEMGLPAGALWARFDDEGNVIEVLPAGRSAPKDDLEDTS